MVGFVASCATLLFVPILLGVSFGDTPLRSQPFYAPATLNPHHQLNTISLPGGSGSRLVFPKKVFSIGLLLLTFEEPARVRRDICCFSAILLVPKCSQSTMCNRIQGSSVQRIPPNSVAKELHRVWLLLCAKALHCCRPYKMPVWVVC